MRMARKKQASDGIVAAFIVLIVAILACAAFFYIYTHGTPALFAKEASPRTARTSVAGGPTPAPDTPQTPPALSAPAVAPEADASSTPAAPPAPSPVPQQSAPQPPVPAFAAETLARAARAGVRTVGFASAAAPIALTERLWLPHCALQDANYADDHERRDFADYSLCYRESYELAEWSAYCLERGELAKNASRTNDFRADPAITTGSASLADYRGSGYDRGHLAPAADFAYAASAMSETFYMSNMTPQAPAFNRGIWQQLEAQVRRWAAEYGRAYVVAGPVLDAPASDYAAIGENAVAVPRAFYKVVLLPLYADDADAATPDDCAALLAYAFVIPNEKCESSFYDYAVPIDAVEALTGIDFFYQLDDALEAALEAGLAAQAE